MVWCSVQETAIRLESSGLHIGSERSASIRSRRLPANLVGLRRTFTLASGYSPSGSILVQVIYPNLLIPICDDWVWKKITYMYILQMTIANDHPIQMVAFVSSSFVTDDCKFTEKHPDLAKLSAVLANRNHEITAEMGDSGSHTNNTTRKEKVSWHTLSHIEGVLYRISINTTNRW